MNKTQFTPAGVNANSRDQPYRYDNSRPLPVFVLAALATLGVLGVTWSAHAALTQATAEERIAPPPDIKKVIERLEDTAGTLFQRDPRRLTPPFAPEKG